MKVTQLHSNCIALLAHFAIARGACMLGSPYSSLRKRWAAHGRIAKKARNATGNPACSTIAARYQADDNKWA